VRAAGQGAVGLHTGDDETVRARGVRPGQGRLGAVLPARTTLRRRRIWRPINPRNWPNSRSCSGRRLNATGCCRCWAGWGNNRQLCLPRRCGRGYCSGHPAGRYRRAHRSRQHRCQEDNQRRGAVIGLRFTASLLTVLGVDPVLDELAKAELIDQVRFTPRAEYAFRHPLIRAVAYESQLKSDRGELHRRLAAAIQERHPESMDENAALIAEHLEAAGDLHAAYGWHMRAGAWSRVRDVSAARVSWERARQIADALPADDANRLAMRIAPRTMLCANA
jgi:hypothetical protein